MKYTMLSSKDNKLLENLIIKHGQIVTTSQIFEEAKNLMNEKQTQYLITTLIKKGWLIRIRRALYQIADLSTVGFLSLSPYVVAHLLLKDAYVSFESALNHHGMLDQLTNKIISVSLSAHKTVSIQNIEYSFIKTKEKYFFGWLEQTIGNEITYIATAEKTLIDMIHFHRSSYSIDVVIEKLQQYKNDLNVERLNDYISKMSMTTIKIFGFIFDLLKFDSGQLLKQTKLAKGAHKMASKSKAFNAKWRLYYDAYFDKYT